MTSWKLTENFAKLSKGCFSRSHTWFVHIWFLSLKFTKILKNFLFSQNFSETWDILKIDRKLCKTLERLFFEKSHMVCLYSVSFFKIYKYFKEFSLFSKFYQSLWHLENWQKILQNFGKAVFWEVRHGLFTFSFLSLLAVHSFHGRRVYGAVSWKSRNHIFWLCVWFLRAHQLFYNKCDNSFTGYLIFLKYSSKLKKKNSDFAV